MPSFELLLALGVLGFYLYDSSMLLYINELVFIRGRRFWSFRCPGENWTLLGRRLYIPNPLTPDVPLFRLHWIDSNSRFKSDEGSLEEYLAALVPVQYLTMTLLLVFFAILPLFLFWYGSGPQLLWLFGVIYLNIILVLTVVYQRKSVFGLSNREFLSLAFESLVCAPFALNILRKLTLHRSLRGDPIDLAKILFDREVSKQLVDAVGERIDRQLESIELDSQRYLSLQSYKTRIFGMKQ
jgi:hypothetical protein